MAPIFGRQAFLKHKIAHKPHKNTYTIKPSEKELPL